MKLLTLAFVALVSCVDTAALVEESATEAPLRGVCFITESYYVCCFYNESTGNSWCISNGPCSSTGVCSD